MEEEKGRDCEEDYEEKSGAQIGMGRGDGFFGFGVHHCHVGEKENMRLGENWDGN